MQDILFLALCPHLSHQSQDLFKPFFKYHISNGIGEYYIINHTQKMSVELKLLKISVLHFNFRNSCLRQVLNLGTYILSLLKSIFVV